MTATVSRRFKRGIASVVERLGYEIRKKPAEAVVAETSHFESCLHVLLGMNATINIVQVGANDGAINDPLYKFVSAFPERVRLILVEPQSQLLPFLLENYRFHDTKYVFNGAVGPKKHMELHRIREDCWNDLVVPYAAKSGWPLYRAPTGITSASYEHVATWLSRHYRGQLPLSEVIETISVEAIDMRSLLERAKLFSRPDVLQIDAEGFDDEVIYASNIDELHPLIINFELNHLERARADALTRFLADHGYIVSPHGVDGLAVRAVPLN